MCGFIMICFMIAFIRYPLKMIELLIYVHHRGRFVKETPSVAFVGGKSDVIWINISQFCLGLLNLKLVTELGCHNFEVV